MQRNPRREEGRGGLIMAKREAEEITKEVVLIEKEAAHPYAFDVSGPRNLSSPNWRDLISSSWSVPTFISLYPLQSFIFHNILLLFWPPGFHKFFNILDYLTHPFAY